MTIETTPATPAPLRTPDGDPADATTPDPHVTGTGAAPTRRPGRLAAVTVLVATVAVVAALVGLVWGTRPLQTPTQDCGTAFSYLLDGGIDVFVDPADPPTGVTATEAEANNATPCQERAAGRSRPAGALVVGGTLVAAAAALVDLGARGLRRYRSTHMPPVRAHRPG